MTDVKIREWQTRTIMQIMFFHRDYESGLFKRSKGSCGRFYWAEEINSDLGGGWDKPQMETISLFCNGAHKKTNSKYTAE